MIPDLDAGALYHHERYDGKGYPFGLKGNDIPLTARIIAVADSFDAMSTKRIYRDPLPKDVILSELRKNRGTQFAPEILDIFIELYERDEI
ncbi:MAG: HD domain-containing protein [Lachnospiraceae bacterium]|nr:HD domain-containing protein [Lachnospiraceae bacterium]